MIDKEYYAHRPVMLNEVIDYLNLSPGKVIVDCTVAGGGHAAGILERILPQGMLVGIDIDQDALEIAGGRFAQYGNAVKLIHRNFKDLGLILRDLDISRVDGLLFDLGMSCYQLNNTQRGFSFRFNSPLDMRMDKTQELTAYDLVNHLDEEALSNILESYAQERFAKHIARNIVRARKRNSIYTTGQLIRIISDAIPGKYQSRHIHPATRTFQALRIAVNNELDNFSFALDNVFNLLSSGARIVIISFHSLEDRIAKNKLRNFAQQNYLKIITKKPIGSSDREIAINPHARSAKLRVGERL